MIHPGLLNYHSGLLLQLFHHHVHPLLLRLLLHHHVHPGLLRLLLRLLLLHHVHPGHHPGHHPRLLRLLLLLLHHDHPGHHQVLLRLHQAVERQGLGNVGMAAPTIVVRHKGLSYSTYDRRTAWPSSVFATEKKASKKIFAGPKSVTAPLDWIIAEWEIICS
jgi:hypothetical protein